jgi:splicing factor 3A subunit 3
LILSPGAERLKEVLQGLGLKSGGSLRERAARLYLTKSTPLAQLDKKHFAKGVIVPTTAAAAAAAAAGGKAEVEKAEEVALQVCVGH